MISAILIVRDEAPRLEACLESIRPHVDELVIVDTGSTDGTPEIAKRFADRFEVFTGCNDERGRIADFSAARNFALDLATHEWVFWLDGDDVVRGAEKLRGICERENARRGANPFLMMFPYEYAHDETGRVLMVHVRERLGAPREAFRFTDPVHECMIPVLPNCAIEQSSEVTIVHNRRTKAVAEPNRNLRILRAHWERNPDANARHLYYLGLEYGNVGDLGQSIQFHRRYIERSNWEDEKFLACLEVARHFQTMGVYQESLDYAWKALQAREGWFGAYYYVGRAYYFLAQRGGPETRRNWERAVHYFGLGLALPENATVLFVSPLDRTHEVYKFLNVALNALGLIDQALKAARLGLEAKPDAGLEANARQYEAFLARRDLDRVLGALGIAPARAASIRALLDEPEKPTELAEGKFDIIVYVGQSWEPWTPETAAKNGIGGSETAVIEMTKRWAKDGHRCRVFGDCQALEGTYDGVEYLHFERFPGTRCDVLVSSRRPDVVDDGVCDAALRFVWIHDVHLGGGLTHARALRTDRFLCLSEWHKGNVLAAHPQIHPDQVVVTRNGIDLGRFAVEGIERDPHRAIYSSSPDRGLEVLLDVWPRIRERVPDATLDIFYGFTTWEGMARNDPDQLAVIAKLKAKIEALDGDGVVYHGRRSQDVVARAMLSAGVWAYPTWFSETSCITAMEAQAAGLYIVTSPIAALRETVGARGHMIDGDWLSPEYQTAFVGRVVGAMMQANQTERETLRSYAAKFFGWDSLAAEWIEMFRSIEPGQMPPYKGFQ